MPMGIRNVMTGQRDIQKELETVRKDVDRLRNDLREAIGTVAEVGRSNVTGMREDARRQLNQRLEHLSRRCGLSSSASQRDGWQSSAREHPWLAAAIVAGLGAVVFTAVRLIFGRGY